MLFNTKILEENAFQAISNFLNRFLAYLNTKLKHRTL